jgi:hypothetical protein
VVILVFITQKQTDQPNNKVLVEVDNKSVMIAGNGRAAL